VFSILNQTSTLGDSCFYSNVPAEAVTVAIVNYSSFHCLCWFLTKKLNLFNKQCFYWNNVQSQKLQQGSKCSLSALIQAHNRFAIRLLPCR